jgi:Ca2+-binding RTX toxin-like protein
VTKWPAGNYPRTYVSNQQNYDATGKPQGQKHSITTTSTAPIFTQLVSNDNGGAAYAYEKVTGSGTTRATTLLVQNYNAQFGKIALNPVVVDKTLNSSEFISNISVVSHEDNSFVVSWIHTIFSASTTTFSSVSYLQRYSASGQREEPRQTLLQGPAGSIQNTAIADFSSPLAGFDTSTYPGDPAMDWLKDHTNLGWVAYYLAPAPSRSNSSWMGQRADLEAQGWKLAPVYVGEQPSDNDATNTHKDPSAANGLRDGTQTVNEMNAEGFAKGTTVYLDVEPGTLGSDEIAYIQNWYSIVSAADFIPGIYSRLNQATRLANLVPAPLWVVREFNPWKPTPPVMAEDPNGYTSFPSPHPSTSGYADAIARQYVLDDFQNYTIFTPSKSFTADLDSVLEPVVIKGTVEADSLSGTAKNDFIFGLSGADVIQGGAGKDKINGGNGNDTVFGGDNGDVLYGEADDDKLDGGAGNDVLNGGSGIDTASYEDAASGVTVKLAVTTAQNTGGAGSDTLSGFENLTGSAFGDVLTGSSEANVIKGLDGNDTLKGLGGADTLTGNSGKDIFQYQNINEGSANEHITDFVIGQDLIKLVAGGFSGAKAGVAPVVVNDGAPTTAQGTLLFNTAISLLSWDRDGTGPLSSQPIATLDGVHSPLHSTDFKFV